MMLPTEAITINRRERLVADFLATNPTPDSFKLYRGRGTDLSLLAQTIVTGPAPCDVIQTSWLTVEIDENLPAGFVVLENQSGLRRAWEEYRRTADWGQFNACLKRYLSIFDLRGRSGSETE